MVGGGEGVNAAVVGGGEGVNAAVGGGGEGVNDVDFVPSKSGTLIDEVGG